VTDIRRFLSEGGIYSGIYNRENFLYLKPTGKKQLASERGKVGLPLFHL